jgi:hypothetical protein
MRCVVREKEGLLQLEVENQKVNELIRKQHGFHNGRVSRGTVYSWICILDFNYSIWKNQYFVDKHEEHKEQRATYIHERIEKEIQQPVWLQMSDIEFKNLQDSESISSSLEGYTFQDKDGRDMVEIQIDCYRDDTIKKG